MCRFFGTQSEEPYWFKAVNRRLSRCSCGWFRTRELSRSHPHTPTERGPNMAEEEASEVTSGGDLHLPAEPDAAQPLSVPPLQDLPRDKPPDLGEMEPPLPKLKKRDFTLAELKPYDGLQDPRILMAVNGKVFDVTRGKKFYGPVKYDYIGKLLKPGEEPAEYTDDEEVKDKKTD
ncbi:hypothetical protein F7725_006553 [Dissostichus mawsoni]|uniref:Progesterone receptor membrane component 1 n=1 Tax=Dissostichus mawsoni TaxID=36200 RepID=A0A7J5XUW9_DISMA|nr:hypothetical protein F7725_006553 [Dissostichus mawsoni]